jgi:hypothetical protein
VRARALGLAFASLASAAPTHIQVDAGRAVGRVEPLWGDHYDLSVLHRGHLQAPNFREALRALRPRSWRCSVGRWEVGHPAPPQDEREFYRGPDTLAGADDLANYHLSYLDEQLAAIRELGAEPFLCFDYMPRTLARRKRRGGPGDVGARRHDMSFSDGIRNSPPANPEVYARVVRRVMRHAHEKHGVTWFEIGNEPDLTGPRGEPIPIFWSGTRQDFAATYLAVAREVVRDPALAAVKLGFGSFGMTPTERMPTFLESTVRAVVEAGARCDFVSYHSYADAPEAHLAKLEQVVEVVRGAGLDADLVNGEWGRKLDGAEPIYATLAFGLFRARVMNLMQQHRVRFAHEALLRDPFPIRNFFGLLGHGPWPDKPVTSVYRALNRLTHRTRRLATRGGCEGCVLAASTETGASRAVLVIDPTGEDLEVQVEGLSYSRAMTIERRELREGRSSLQSFPAREHSGDRVTLRTPATGGPRLVLWEIRGPGGTAPQDAPEPAPKEDAFATSAARLEAGPVRATPAFRRALEDHRGLFEARMKASAGNPPKALATLQSMHGTMGSLMARSSDTPMARPLLWGYLKVASAYHDLLARVGRVGAATVLRRKTRERVEWVYGARSSEAREALRFLR